MNNNFLTHIRIMVHFFVYLHDSIYLFIYCFFLFFLFFVGVGWRGGREEEGGWGEAEIVRE